ncbi:MAG: anaerobic ribonucleoside-triphosphate reductase activating protein [Lentisphaerae bacterium]|nr:anaerobic ribonucleoside-triphosphate reductase activating protein [Lentisphaerota bacterium]
MSEQEYCALYARMLQPSLVDYPGKMSALFFTRGCNFRCGYCHNQSLLEPGQRNYTWQELEGFCREYQKQWVEALTITGGEPCLQPKLPETLKFLRKQGFMIKLDSNGSRPEALKLALPLLDYVAMDIKCSLPKYKQLCSWSGDEQQILASIKLIMQEAKDYEFRTTLIEGLHDDEEIIACAKLVQGAKKLVFQPFLPHPDLPDPKFRTLERTRASFLQHAAKLASKWVRQASVRGE